MVALKALVASPDLGPGEDGQGSDWRTTPLPSIAVHGPKYVMFVAVWNILANAPDTGPGCYVNTPAWLGKLPASQAHSSP